MRDGQYLWVETNGGPRPVFITGKTSFLVFEDNPDWACHLPKKGVWYDFKKMISAWRLK